MTERSGQCLCGAVKFKATPQSDEVGACHCSMCQKTAAGPFVEINCGDTLRFVDETQLGVYNSSDWAERCFCKQCGSPLVWRTKDHKMNHVSANAFDDLGPVKFTHEVFIDEKPDYYDFKQKTHQMTGAEVMKMFAEAQGN